MAAGRDCSGPLSLSEAVIQLIVDRVALPLDQPPLLRASPVDLTTRRYGVRRTCTLLYNSREKEPFMLLLFSPWKSANLNKIRPRLKIGINP